MQWSKERDAVSLDVYDVVLQYVNMRRKLVQGAENMQTNPISFQERVENFQTYFFSDTKSRYGLSDLLVAIYFLD